MDEVSKIYYEPDPSDLAVEEAEEYEELGCLVKRKWICQKIPQ